LQTLRDYSALACRARSHENESGSVKISHGVYPDFFIEGFEMTNRLTMLSFRQSEESFSICETQGECKINHHRENPRDMNERRAGMGKRG
jgi:hypothetical protein